MAVGTNIMDTTHEVFFLDFISECRKKYEELCPGMVISAKMSAVQLCSQNRFTLSKLCMNSDPQVDFESFDKSVVHCLHPGILTIRRKGTYMPLAEVQKHMHQNSYSKDKCPSEECRNTQLTRTYTCEHTEHRTQAKSSIVSHSGWCCRH